MGEMIYETKLVHFLRGWAADFAEEVLELCPFKIVMQDCLQENASKSFPDLTQVH